MSERRVGAVLTPDDMRRIEQVHGVVTIPAITSRPDICCGEPCVAGTRIPAQAIKDFAAAGYTIDEIQREYPTLTREQIEAARRYEPTAADLGTGLNDPAERASTEAFAKAMALIEALPAAESVEAMRAAALKAISDHAGMPLEAEEYESPEEIAEALERLKDSAARAAFNAALAAGPPRIKVIPVDPTGETLGFADGPGFHGVGVVPTYPRSPRGEAMRDFRREHNISRRDLATALCISVADVCGLERGSKTTNDDGWMEIQTTLFMLGGGRKAEHIADPWSDPALELALAEDDTAPPPVAPPAAPPVEHSSEPGDVCPACSDVLGSPSPCAISHDVAPGAYPPPEPELEPAVGDEPR